MSRIFKSKGWILPILCLLIATLIACTAQVDGTGSKQAGIATFPHHFVPSEEGAGVAIDCGGTYPGLRGDYLCSISQVGNDITITYQVPDATEDGGVRDETLTFSLAGGQADGVVTSGAFSANNENLVLTVTAGGTDTTVSVPVPAAIRAGASLSDADPQDVAETGAQEGTSTDVSRADHVHAGDRQRAYGTHDPADIGTTAAPGTNTTVSRSDHAHGGQRGFDTDPPQDVTTGSGSVGTSDELSRADHQHGGDTDTTLTFGAGAPANVTTGTGTVGVLGTTSRSDHVHGGDSQRTLSDTNPLDVSRASVPGTSTEVSRYDHVHAGRSPLHIANATAVQTAQSFAFTVAPAMSNTPPVGTTVIWKTPATVTAVNNDPGVNIVITGGPNAAVVQPGGTAVVVSQLIANAAYVVVWDGSTWQIPDKVAGAANLSDNIPEGVGIGAGEAGTSGDASRSDHAHQLDSGQRLPTNATDGQVVAWQTSSNSWIAATVSGMGVATFLSLSDTPNAYTGSGGFLVRINSGGTALEFFAEPANPNTIPHVGRIPTVTATSPDLVFLSHDEIDGNREDATLTIATSGGFCGYGTEPIFGVFGDLSEPSPIEALIGVWDSVNSDCTLSDVYSLNEGWLDDQDMIVGEVAGVGFSCDLGTRLQNHGMFLKRILSCTSLDDLALGDIEINFLTADAPPVAYWTDGEIFHPAGLYEKVGTPPAYHDIRPIEESHRQGQGSFACGESEPPTDGGQVCIDSDGRASFSTDRVRFFEMEPEITMSAALVSDYWQGAGSDILDFNYNGENGEFKWYLLGDVFFQIQGTRASATFNISGTENTVIPSGTVFERDGAGTTFVRTTAEATIPVGGIVNNVPVEAATPGATANSIPATATFTPDPAFQGITGATIQTGFSGGTGSGLVSVLQTEEIFTWIASIDDADTAAEQALHDALAADSEFLGEFSQVQDAAEDRDGYDSTTTRYFYIIHGDEDDLLEITGFTAGESTEIDDHQWVGPVVTIEDVHDVFEVNAEGDPYPEAFSNLRVGDNIYTAIVRPDETSGVIRDPVAADWDNIDGFSRSVGWDGDSWFEVERYFEGAHSADAVFTEIASGTEFSIGGRTYRWRGENSSPSPNINPRDGDFIFYTGTRTLYEYVVDSRGFTANWVARSDQGLLARSLEYVGGFPTQDIALSHVTQNGDRIIYEREPERARGVIRFVGAEGTNILVGTRVTAQNTTIEFEVIEDGTIPDTGQIDLDARAVSGGSDGNVTDNTLFTHAITGVTAATAEGDFTRGDNIARGYRLFTVSEFVEPESGEYLYRWKPLGVQDDVELLVGPNRGTGLLRDATNNDYDEYHTQSAVVAFDGNQFQKVSRRVIGATTASGTWTTVPDRTDITGTSHRWRQTHWQDYLVGSPEAGDVYYNRTQGFRDYDGSNWHSVGVSEVFSSEDIEYLGAFNTEQQATDFATMDGQWALIVVNGAPIMQSLSGHSAASPEHYEYFWTPVNPSDRFPGPNTALQDQLLRYDVGSGQWTGQNFVTGDSLTGIGTSGDPLNVNTHDVIEKLTEHIRYYHGDPQSVTDRGATVCEVYITGPYQYGVTHIRVGIDAPAAGAHYRGRIYTLQDNNVIMAKLGDTPERGFSTGGQSHYLYFDSNGVVVEDNTRVAICVSRTRVDDDRETRLYFGNEDADSPEVSYPDADEDWDRRGWVHYQHVDPAVGNTTHQHDTDGNAQIHGNIEIYYTRTVNHGHLVGDGNVDLDHLADDVTARLLPGTATDNQIAQYDAGTSMWLAEDLSAMAGAFTDLTDTPASITASQCVRGNAAGTALEFAQCGTGGGTITSDATLTGDGSAGDPLGVANPFEASDEVRLLPDSPTDGQVAVWNESNTAWEADDRTSTGTVDGVVLVDDATYGWQTTNGPSQEVHFSRALADTDDELLITFDWREWETTDPGANYRDAGASILAKHVRTLSNLPPLALQKTGGGDTPIDRTVAITEANVQGSVTFKFPQHTAGHPLSDMRLIYIGDHVDDINEDVNQSETDIDVDSSAGLIIGRNYWIVGPVSGCTETSYHAEKVELISIVSDGEITVTRNIDNTELPASNCSFASGGDLIDDNKRYFTLVNSDADQDNAVVSVTLMPSGGGSGSGDITAITTPVGSGIGLTGCDSGDCDIALDIPGMASVGLNLITTADEIIVLEGGLHRRTTLGNISQFTFGRIANQTDVTALADADSFVINDASEGSSDPREVTAARLSNYVGTRLAGSGLTYNTTTNQIDGGGAPQIELIDSLNDVTYTQADIADLSPRFGGGATAYVADIDADGTADAEINDLIVFQWRDNPAAVPGDRALGIRINETGTTLPIRIVDPLTNSLTNKTRADLTRYEFLFLSRQDGVFIQLAGLALSDVMARLVPTGGTAGQVLTKDTATDFDVSWTTVSGGGAANVQAFAQENQEEQPGIDEYVRQQVFGNMRVYPHLLTADEGIDEAVRYIGNATMVPSWHTGQTLNARHDQQASYNHGNNDPATDRYTGLDARLQGRLESSIGQSDRQLTLTNIDDLEVGQYLRVGGSEYMEITAIDESTREVTVRRGSEIQPTDILEDHNTNDPVELMWKHMAKRVPHSIHDEDVDAQWSNIRTVYLGTDTPYITFNIRFDDADSELTDWRDLGAYVRFKRRDGVGRVVEGIFPFRADRQVGADQVGDPYSAREIGLRVYLGLPAGSQQSNSASDSDEDVRAAAFTRGPARTINEDMQNWFYRTSDYDVLRLDSGSTEYEGDVLKVQQQGTLDGAITASDTVLTLSSVTNLTLDHDLRVGNERMQIDSIDTVNTQVTVTRLTGAYSHVDGAQVWRYPSLSKVEEYLVDFDFAFVDLTDPRLDAVQLGVLPGESKTAANPTGVTSETTRLDSITIRGRDYNTAHVVLPDPTSGDLRAPVEADWDATNGLSRVLAFDGVDLYRAARRLTGAHTSSATFTEVARDTVINGDTTEDCTWKGVHWTDSLADSSPTVNDCYFNRRESKFRWYYSNGWFDVTSYVVFRGLTYKGEHSNEDEALAAVNGNSEYVIYNDASGNPHLYLTSAYVAGQAGHYIYEWKDANAGLAPDVQSEIELHSSATVTEDAEDWVAFALDRVPGQDSEIELRMTGASSQTHFSMSAGEWLGLTVIPAAQVTDSDDDDPLSQSSAVTFPVYHATSIGGLTSEQASAICAVGRQSNTSLLIGCNAASAMNFGLEIVEIP